LHAAFRDVHHLSMKLGNHVRTEVRSILPECAFTMFVRHHVARETGALRIEHERQLSQDRPTCVDVIDSDDCGGGVHLAFAGSLLKSSACSDGNTVSGTSFALNVASESSARP
jgi:hypothetical protein